jgi:hypothetical protein
VFAVVGGTADQVVETDVQERRDDR